MLVQAEGWEKFLIKKFWPFFNIKKREPLCVYFNTKFFLSTRKWYIFVNSIPKNCLFTIFYKGEIMYKWILNKTKFPSAKNSISMCNSILSFLTFFWHIMSKNKLMMKVCLHCCCTFIMGTYLHSFYLIQFYKIRLEGMLPKCPRIHYIIRNRKHLWFNIVVNNPILQKKERQTGKLP